MNQPIYSAVLIGMMLAGCATPSIETPPPDPTLPEQETEALLTPLPSPTYEPIISTTTTTPIMGDYYREVARLQLKGRLGNGRLSPDESMLAIPSSEGLYLYDARSLELRWQNAQLGSGGSVSVAWLNNDEVLLMPIKDTTYVLSAMDSSVVREIATNLEAFSLSPDGRHYIEYPHDTIHNTTTGEIVLTMPSAIHSSIIWMPDSNHVLFFGDSLPAIWNIESGSIVRELESEYPTSQLWYSGFSRDGRYFATLLEWYDALADEVKNEIVVWNLDSGEQITAQQIEGTPSENGWQLDEDVILLDQWYAVRLTETGAQAANLRLNGDLIRTQDGFIAIFIDAIIRFDTQFQQVMSVDGFNGGGESKSNSALSPDGRMLALESFTRYYIWDIDRDELLSFPTTLYAFGGAYAVWSPSSARLAIAAHMERMVFFWDATTRQTRTLALDYYPCDAEWVDESILALALTDRRGEYNTDPCPPASYNHFLALLDTQTSELIHLEQRPLSIDDLQRSPDGQNLGFIERNDLTADPRISQMVVWNINSRHDIYTSAIPALYFEWIPNSQLAAIWNSSDNTSIVDPITGLEQTIVPIHPFDLGSEAVSTDYLVATDFYSKTIGWLAWDGQVILGEFPFYLREAKAVVTPNGQIYVALNPIQWETDLIALIELLPPELNP